MNELVDLNNINTIEAFTDNTKPTENKKYNLADCEVIFGVDVAEPDPILKINDVLVLSRGDISCIKGKAKSRKSFFVAYIVSLVLNQNPAAKILLIDTEQSKYFVVNVMKRIYKLMGWINLKEQFRVLSLREYDVQDRKGILIQAIEEYCSDFIVLDGGVDIISDFNDPTESKAVVGLLMKISTTNNCHILSILHEGKSNGELRGHYGAEMLNKSQTVFEVVKDGEVSNVSPYATRSMPFDEFSFRIEDGLPVHNGEINRMTKKEMLEYNMKLFSTKLLAPNKQMEYEDFANEYAQLVGCTSRTAKTHLSNLQKLNYIGKDSRTKMYFLVKYEPLT
ncbi:MAG: hypothetical protein WCG93_08305 [Paludibacter sp.]